MSDVSEQPIRLCKDCLWVRPGDAVEYTRWDHPASVCLQEPNLITGNAPAPIALACTASFDRSVLTCDRIIATCDP
jgi:hypothetical protein